MQWIDKIIDEVVASHPAGEIVVSSGVSPSGTYHVGTLREVLTADALMLELRARGRASRHIHVVDDLDIFRKVPAGIPEDYSQYLGKPLCDIPAPDNSGLSYADYFLRDFLTAAKTIHLEMDIMRSHEKYRSGFMAPAIEKILGDVQNVKNILTDVSGRELDDSWTPIQVVEGGYLKKRKLISIDAVTKYVTYVDKDGREQTADYARGEVKLDWRLDWPARWWLLAVAAEPFGRDHATKGGSYDTGSELAKRVFTVEPPIPIPYHFINRVGETKKMSKSAGDSIAISELTQVLPPEVIRFFALRSAPHKQLFFSEVDSVIKLIDEFAELLAKKDKTPGEQQLLRLCTAGVDSIVSRVPFSHLVASYQAALKNPEKTLAVIARAEYAEVVAAEQNTILQELRFIDEWLNRWAPEDVKFEPLETVDAGQFNDGQKAYLGQLADKIATAPPDADGEWFHKAIYEFRNSISIPTKDLFTTLYRAIIGKNSGPRAGWFLSILPREWLIKRLRFEA